MATTTLLADPSASSAKYLDPVPLLEAAVVAEVDSAVAVAAVVVAVVVAVEALVEVVEVAEVDAADFPVPRLFSSEHSSSRIFISTLTYFSFDYSDMKRAESTQIGIPLETKAYRFSALQHLAG